MFRFNESRLCFSFGEPWTRVLQWDKHPAYLQGLARQPSTAAVDFFGLYGTRPTFVEVKNFREYRIQNKSRLSSGALADEVADKVRDTVAGIVWARHRPHDDRDLEAILRHVFGTGTKCHVVLWLEEDPGRDPAEREGLVLQIQQRLRWLNPHVIVCDRAAPHPGLEVSGATKEP